MAAFYTAFFWCVPLSSAQAKAKAALERVLKRTMAESEELLREKILGSIGGGAFELLRAFRRMHRGRGTVGLPYFFVFFHLGGGGGVNNLPPGFKRTGGGRYQPWKTSIPQRTQRIPPPGDLKNTSPGGVVLIPCHLSSRNRSFVEPPPPPLPPSSPYL